MNRADAIVIEALKGKPDPKREYTLVNEKGRSRHELADDGWADEGVAEDMLVMSRIRVVPETKPEPVAVKTKATVASTTVSNSVATSSATAHRVAATHAAPTPKQALPPREADPKPTRGIVGPPKPADPLTNKPRRPFGRRSK